MFFRSYASIERPGESVKTTEGALVRMNRHTAAVVSKRAISVSHEQRGVGKQSIVICFNKDLRLSL